jgi:thioredoxin-related protein
MKRLLTLFFIICAIEPVFSKEGESSGDGIKMWVVKSTFGSFKEEDEEALLKMAVAGDADGIMALVKEGKSIPLERGIKALVLYEDKLNNLYQVFLDPDPNTSGKEIRVWAPRNFLWSAGITGMSPIPLPSEERVADIVPVVPFDPASLPRVPIHFPARRLSYDEVIKLSMRTEGNPVMTAWCWCDHVASNAEEAIKEMMRDRNGLVHPYVVYGPIPDEHNALDTNAKYNTWYVEIQFNLADDPRVYTAVIHGGRSGIASCQLGEDKPTLKVDSRATVKSDVSTGQAEAPDNISSAPVEQTGPGSFNWLTGMEEASAQAISQNKDILINFTGLSWSAYCVQMEKEVLSQSSFLQFASQHLVLVKFDFPRAQNQASREAVDQRDHYGVQNFPTSILVNSAGVEISRLVGYAPESQFLKWLRANENKESETPEIAAPAPQGGDHEFLLSIINAMANYDWQTLTAHMLDGQVNYFGHRHSYLGYVINDIQNDARQFGKQNLTCYWDTFSHEVSENMFYDSVNIYAVIPERSGRTHHAMERLTVGYSYVNGETKIYSLTLKVLHS